MSIIFLHFWGWWFIPIAMIIFCVIAILILSRFKGFQSCCCGFQNNKCQTDSETSMELLKRRYADGKISHEEFEKIKAQIQSK